VRCYWEHPWGIHWEPDGNVKGTCWEQRENEKKKAGGEVDGKCVRKHQAIYRKHKARHHHASGFTPGNMASESDKQNVPEFFFLKFFLHPYLSLSGNTAFVICMGYIYIIYFTLLRFHSFQD
jgi:hypothetical protein